MTLRLPRTVHGSLTLDVLRLPARVTGSFRVPEALRVHTAQALPAAHRRDLRPAALTLLAMVGASACLLAVATWWTRKEREA